MHLLTVSEPLVRSLSVAVCPAPKLREGLSPWRARRSALWPLASLTQAWRQAAVSPQCLSFAQARYKSLYCPFRQKKISVRLTVHAQWILCLHHLRSMGFCHLHCSSVHWEISMQRPGVQEKGQLWAHTGVQEKVGRCKADLHTPGSFLHCLCRAKPGEEWCLNDTRWVQKGETPNQRADR